MAAVSLSCSGNVDEDSSPVLLCDKTAIEADGKDAATFTVTYNGEDVTGEALIVNLNDGTGLDGATFSTATAGTYRFQAEYDGMTSEPVTIAAGIAPMDAYYKKNYCIADFTAQKCTFCPNGTDYLLGYFLKNTMAGETVEVLAFHSDSMGEDIFSLEATGDMMEHFKLSNLPSYAFDMRVAGEQSILKGAYESASDYPPSCGLAMASELSEDGASAKVTVRLSVSEAASCRVALFVVEDGVIAPQDTQTGTVDDYNHRHVVRAVASATWQGDRFGDMVPGQEVAKEYTVALDEAWNVENVTFCAVVYDESGYADNCRSCKADGGDAGYEIN